METRTEVVKAVLPSGVSLSVETSILGGEEDVSAAQLLQFADFSDAIGGLAELTKAAVAQVRPQKTTIEFGLELGLESGKLSAILVKGTGKANFKVTLEWGEDT